MTQLKEKVLLYNFKDDETVAKIKMICRKMNIENSTIPVDDYNQKIGFLLGMRAYSAAKETAADDFDFEDEVLILSHLNNKRLDRFLSELKQSDVPVIKYKAVVTPFNTMWTLRRLCETMRREHGAIQEGKINTNG